MSTTEPLDADRLSRLIELRLKEMNRPDEAAAFVRLGVLRRMLDVLSTTVEQAAEFAAVQHRLGAAYAQKRQHFRGAHFDTFHPVEKPAYLTPIDSEHNALVLDFDSMVTKLGELSLQLLNRVTPASDHQEHAVERRFGTNWELDDPDELFAAPKRIPLQGSLVALKPVGELSHAYNNPDFSKNRLRPANFLR